MGNKSHAVYYFKSAMETHTVYLEVVKAFDGNEQKAEAWMVTPNMNFGGASPTQLIFGGKGNKVIQFIWAQRSLS